MQDFNSYPLFKKKKLYHMSPLNSNNYLLKKIVTTIGVWNKPYELDSLFIIILFIHIIVRWDLSSVLLCIKFIKMWTHDKRPMSVCIHTVHPSQFLCVFQMTWPMTQLEKLKLESTITILLWKNLTATIPTCHLWCR